MRSTASFRRLRAGVLGTLLAAVALATLPAVAETGAGGVDGFAVHDDETVYVVAEPTGEARDVIVVSWLRVEGQGTLALFDPGRVSDPEALEDEMEPAVRDAGVEWRLDVEGRRDFFYRATTDLPLPVEVEAAYYLDGRRVEPSALAGASGRVKIEVTVTNNLAVTEEVTYTDADGLPRTEEVEYWVPFLCPVKIDVDGTRFRDIVGDAQIMSVTGSTISHTFMAFPQPSETVTIEMDGTDIAIEPIVVSVFPKMAGSPDFSIADDLAALRDGLDGLTALSEGHREVLGTIAEGIDPAEFAQVVEAPAAFGQLASGAAEIGSGARGLAALVDGQIAYLDGVIAGIEGQAAGLGQVAELPGALREVSAGLSGVRDGVDGLAALLDGQLLYLDAIIASNTELETGAWALASAVPTDTTAALATGLSAQGMMLAALRDGDEAMGMPLGLTDLREQLGGVSQGLTTIITSLDAIAEGAAPLAGLPGQFDALAAALRTLRDGGVVQGQQLPGLATTRSGLAGVADGVGELGGGIRTAAGALEPLTELPQMLGELRTTLIALRDGGSVRGTELPGISTTVEGLGAASDGLAEGIGGFSLGEVVTETMKRAASEYDTFLGTPEGATGEVRFIIRLDGIEAPDAE